MFTPEIIAITSLYLAIIRREHSTASGFLGDGLASLEKYAYDIEQVINCVKAFLELWRFKGDRSNVSSGELVIKRAKKDLLMMESTSKQLGASDKNLKTKKFKEKIQGMQKRS